jgi:predicted RNA-binding protein YlxR (DUF448 family)
MLDNANMKARSSSRRKRTLPAKKPVQVSLDRSLLRVIDADAESKVQGRSAFITSAILLYLRAKREKLIDDQIIAVISKQGNEMANESKPLVAAQSFSPDDGDDLIEYHEPEARRAARGR